jgi:hypothetical protein
MNIKWITGAVVAVALTVPAFSQIGIYIGHTPPPLRVEVRPAMPGPGYAWVDGYWGNQGGRYVWVAGRWNQPPYPGATWNHPHYDHYRQGWQYHEGHWDGPPQDRHDDHHDDHHDDQGHR